MTLAKRQRRPGASGRLRIGDDWNAITIIALSQSNPLKAVAEFVENSIDARAGRVTITRGRDHGEHYLAISDDGDGIPRDEQGLPDFRYVATHICDSIKRRLKAQGAQGIQGEFGIGLLSFWTVGEELALTSTSADGRAHQMRMRKGDPNYTVMPRHTLFPHKGTELKIKPLLPGIRQFSGEKIQWYLASELRDRIRQSGVKVTIIDRQARREYQVEPRRFSGRLLHELPRPAIPRGEVYLELYLSVPDPENRVGLYRSGTRVLADIAELDAFRGAPWNAGFLQGIVDAPTLNLTPGTRSGIIQDAEYEAFCSALAPVAARVSELIEEQRRAEEERASRDVLRTIQRAFQEALMALPAEEYDWFDVGTRNAAGPRRPPDVVEGAVITEEVDDVAVGDATTGDGQKQFFEYAGPLFSVRIAPTSCVLPVNQSRTLRAVARDRARRSVEENLSCRWTIAEGQGRIENADGEIVTFHAPADPGLTRLQVAVTQGEVVCTAEGLVTVTEQLVPETKEPASTKQGLPGYTFQRAPGELWRSRYDALQNVIVINNGHRDFVYCARSRALKLRYIARLFAKELVLKNFPGHSPQQLLERMIELSLYTEENLK
ncbi:MAG: ATP-binding protein [Nitrospirota bacterium]